MNEEEKLFPLLQGKTLIINNAEALLRNDPELFKELREAYDIEESHQRKLLNKHIITDLLILATNPNNTRTNISMVVDDYEEDCPVSKETQDRIKGLTHE